MRGQQYFSEDELMALYLVKGYGWAHDMRSLRKLAVQHGEALPSDMPYLECIGERLTGYGEGIATRRYRIHRQTLLLMEPELEAARVALDGVVRRVHSRVMNQMPPGWTRFRKLQRLFELQNEDGNRKK